MARKTKAQQAAGEFNWLIFRLRGARSIFHHKTLAMLGSEELALAREIDTKLNQLRQLLSERNKSNG